MRKPRLNEIKVLGGAGSELRQSDPDPGMVYAACVPGWAHAAAHVSQDRSPPAQGLAYVQVPKRWVCRKGWQGPKPKQPLVSQKEAEHWRDEAR